MFSLSVPPLFTEGNLEKDPSPYRLWQIVSRSFEGITDLWYTDISHRIRHGVSRGYLYDNKAVLTVDFTYGGTAYISSVAVLPGERGQGLGRRLLYSVSRELLKENKTGVVWADESTADYYRKLGFAAVSDDIFFVRTKDR